MAKNKTYNGAPKPYGKGGHFYEKKRHELQGRGIQTGKLAKQMPVPKKEPIIDLGLLPEQTYEELEKQEESFLQNMDEPDDVSYSFTTDIKSEPEVTYSTTADVGAGEVEIEADEVEIKDPKSSFLKELVEGFNIERRTKGEKLKIKAKQELGEDVDLDDFETPEFESRGGKFGAMLADLLGDYRSEDFNELTDAQLEELAVKFDSSAGGLFGKPQNPYLEELKKRIVSREQIKLQKAKIDAELEPARQNIRREIQELKQKAKSGEKEEGDILERLFGV